MLQRVVLLAFSVVLMLTGAMAQNPSPKTPEHLKYYFVFRQISLLNQKAVAAERKGEDGSRYRLHYKKFALLSDRQMSQLDQIANDCLREVAGYDARIKQLVNEVRARIPGGKLEPGRPLPKPPAELRQIDAERDRVIMRAYTRLLDAFGETEFRRFNERIGKSVRINTSQIGARESGSREIPVLPGEWQATVYGVSIIQENGGTVLLYSATSIDGPGANAYDCIAIGSIYETDFSNLKSQGTVIGWPIAEVMISTPALQGTAYAGVGDHMVNAYISWPNGSWYDPACLSVIFDQPILDNERTWFGCGCNCPGTTPNPLIYLGMTIDNIITLSGQ